MYAPIAASLLILATPPARSYTPPRKGVVEVSISVVFRPFKGLPAKVHPPLEIEGSIELHSEAMEGKSRRFTWKGVWKDPEGSFVHIWKVPVVFSTKDLDAGKDFQLMFKSLDIQIKDSSGHKVLRYGSGHDGPLTTIRTYPKSLSYTFSPEYHAGGTVTVEEDISEEVE